MRLLAARVGVSESTLYRWRVTGVDVALSDWIAVVGIGVHPVAVWGLDWLSDEVDAQGVAS
jgi:hypothetical protein